MNPTPNKFDWPNGGPMLAENIDDIEQLYFPMVGQPKLNGIRACWNGNFLISRQRKVWKPHTLPSVYAKLRNWSAEHPGVYLDGELYCHGMPFQEIEAITSVNRLSASVFEGRIDFHAFDIIAEDLTEDRMIQLNNSYSPWVAVCEVNTQKEVELWMNRFCEAGFEGMMLRSKGCPYIHGRTEALIKVKPWKYSAGYIMNHTPGKGKYLGMLGALIVKDDTTGKVFRVSGGLSDSEREQLPEILKRNQGLMMPSRVSYKYRELSKLSIPLQPQVVKLHVI